MDTPHHVEDVMTCPVIAVPPGIAADDLARELFRRRIGAVPIVDPPQHVVGVVTESDLLADRENPWTTARDVMSSPAVTITAGSTVDEARALLTERNIGRLPVVDRDNRLVGIVSRHDLLVRATPNDRRIRRAVIDRAIDVGAEVHAVSVTDGTVLVRGQVAGRSQIPVLEHVLRRIPGVARLEPDFGYDVDDTARPGPGEPAPGAPGILSGGPRHQVLDRDMTGRTGREQ